METKNKPNSTAFVLAHGSWHGAWCWGIISEQLQKLGYLTVAADFPGHGLNAINPPSFQTMPLDAVAFGNEVSALADIGIDAYADVLIAGAQQAKAMGAERIFAVGHSMGGVPATFAASKAPELFAGIFYLASLGPTPGKPAGAYLALEEQHNDSKILDALVADPEVVGALRIDSRSTDADYLQKTYLALAADVEAKRWQSAMHLFTPDGPATMYDETLDFNPKFANLKRVYVRGTEDHLLVNAVGEAFVADMNQAWPNHPTKMINIAASHEMIFSVPKKLVQILISETA